MPWKENYAGTDYSNRTPFRSFGTVKALDDLSLEVPAGSLHAAGTTNVVLSDVALLGGILLATRAEPTRVLVNSSVSSSQFWFMVVLAVLDTIVLGATFVSFQRSRLILH